MIVRIANEEGIRGLYKGFTAGLATYGPFVGLYFAAYEECRHAFGLYYHNTDQESKSIAALPFYANLISGATASAVAAAITCPFDTVKTRIQVEKYKVGKTTSFLVMLSRIWREEGVAALHRGLVARILWIAPGSAITIATCQFTFPSFLLSSSKHTYGNPLNIENCPQGHHRLQ